MSESTDNDDKISFEKDGWIYPNGVCPLDETHTPIYALCGKCRVRAMTKRENRIFSLRKPQTEFAKTFWMAWEVFWGESSFQLHATPFGHPHQTEVREEIQHLILNGIPDEIKASPGYRGLQSQSRWHQSRHCCLNNNPDDKCARCGHPCKLHEVRGPCFSSYSIREWIDEPTRLSCGCPFFGRSLRDRWCSCDGFVSSSNKDERKRGMINDMGQVLARLLDYTKSQVPLVFRSAQHSSVSASRRQRKWLAVGKEPTCLQTLWWSRGCWLGSHAFWHVS